MHGTVGRKLCRSANSLSGQSTGIFGNEGVEVQCGVVISHCLGNSPTVVKVGYRSGVKLGTLESLPAEICNESGSPAH